ncbi:hypothetical protein [Patiriisocius sp. Uisw_047]|uniref:hypothetical protein n=1 Tax=Patiriisocius sp. Uisw_047 TaxID=3230969 RepID=UPI0039E8E788
MEGFSSLEISEIDSSKVKELPNINSDHSTVFAISEVFQTMRLLVEATTWLLGKGYSNKFVWQEAVKKG